MIRRTAQTTDIVVVRLEGADAGEVLTIQRAAFAAEAILYGAPDVPPMIETLEEIHAELTDPAVIGLGARLGHRLVGAVRLRISADGADAYLGRLAVAPDQQGQGIGGLLVQACIDAAPDSASHIDLFTGHLSLDNQRLYERHGFAIVGEQQLPGVTLIEMRKILDRSPT